MVKRVSRRCASAGVTVQTIDVRELPPMLGCSSLVNSEFLKGTCFCFVEAAMMTSFNALKKCPR